MRIDRKLNLVVPIYEDNSDDSPVIAYVHSTPLAEVVVDRYFMVLGQTYNAIFSQGLGFAAGPGHAMRVLRHIATERGVWEDQKDGTTGVARGLVEEIRRLTNVAAIDKEGRWNALPLAVALNQGVISEDDKTEVENAIAFFIASCATLNRAQREGVLKAAGEIWGAQISYLGFTEFLNSLRTSTATGNSGEKSPADADAKPGHATAPTAGKRSSIPY
jgi:hypothetical protein